MSNSAFLFKEWETRVPYYALMKLEEEKVCALEVPWAHTRSKGIRTAMAVTFGGGWRSVMKEAGKQYLKYSGRKALGAVTGVICGWGKVIKIKLNLPVENEKYSQL